MYPRRCTLYPPRHRECLSSSLKALELATGALVAIAGNWQVATYLLSVCAVDCQFSSSVVCLACEPMKMNKTH